MLLFAHEILKNPSENFSLPVWSGSRLGAFETTPVCVSLCFSTRLPHTVDILSDQVGKITKQNNNATLADRATAQTRQHVTPNPFFFWSRFFLPPSHSLRPSIPSVCLMSLPNEAAAAQEVMSPLSCLLPPVVNRPVAYSRSSVLFRLQNILPLWYSP